VGYPHRSGRIIGDSLDRTSVRNVYVVGDALHGRPQLTPVAIRAGVLLARVSALSIFEVGAPTSVFDLASTFHYEDQHNTA